MAASQTFILNQIYIYIIVVDGTTIDFECIWTQSGAETSQNQAKARREANDNIKSCELFFKVAIRS